MSELMSSNMVANQRMVNFDPSMLAKSLEKLDHLQSLKSTDPNTKLNAAYALYLKDLEQIFLAAGGKAKYFDPVFVHGLWSYARNDRHLPAKSRARQILIANQAMKLVQLKSAPEALKQGYQDELAVYERTIRDDNELKRKWLECKQEIQDLVTLGILYATHIKKKWPHFLTSQVTDLIHPEGVMFNAAIAFDRHAVIIARAPPQVFNDYELTTKALSELLLHISLIAEARKFIRLPTAVESAQHQTIINGSAFVLKEKQAFVEWVPDIFNTDTLALHGTANEHNLAQRVQRVVTLSSAQGHNRWGPTHRDITQDGGLLAQLLDEPDPVRQEALWRAMYNQIVQAEKHYWLHAKEKAKTHTHPDIFASASIVTSGETIVANSFTKDNLGKKVTGYTTGVDKRKPHCNRCNEPHNFMYCHYTDKQIQTKVKDGEVEKAIPLTTVLQARITHYENGGGRGGGRSGRGGGNRGGRHGGGQGDYGGGQRGGQGGGRNNRGGGQGGGRWSKDGSRGEDTPKPCWAFARGECKLGSNCNFSHSSGGGKGDNGGGKRPNKPGRVVINSAVADDTEEESEPETKVKTKKTKTKGSGNVHVHANIVELQSSLEHLLIHQATLQAPSDLVVVDSGANGRLLNQIFPWAYNVQPLDNMQARMANRGKLPLRATCETGITGHNEWYIAEDGKMPRSLASVGLTADEGMITVFDNKRCYILHAGTELHFTQDDIATVVDRDPKTGLYMCSMDDFRQPASEYFKKQTLTRSKRSVSRKVKALQPTSDSDSGSAEEES